jgi:putative membrane protein
MRRTELWAAAAAIAVTVTGCSKTEGTKPDETPSATVGTGGAGANLGDDDFVRDVALKNLSAIELSRLALNKTADPDIKSFAQRVIEDHGAAADKLKSAVSGQTVEWPVQLDDEHGETAEELAQKQGADFDRDYLEAMVEGQQNLAAKLESRLDVQSLADWKTAAAGRTDSKALPEPTTAMRDVQVRPNTSDNAATMKVNQWAAETYPLAQKHLDTARRLETAAKKRSTN